jgi:hypothetical protein
MNNLTLPNAVYATKPHDKTSDKYKFIATEDILKQFTTRGFTIASSRGNAISQTAVHAITLDMPASSNPFSDKGLKPQVTVINSHDASKSVQIWLGMIRLICLNGLVAGSHITQPVRVKHVGTEFYNKLNAGIDRILLEAKRLEMIPDNYGSLQLTRSEQHSFALQCALWRFPNHKAKSVAFEDISSGLAYIAPSDKLGNVDETKLKTIDIGSILKVQRMADNSDDLWTVFNRVQENIVRNGIKYTYQTERDVKKRTGYGFVNGGYRPKYETVKVLSTVNRKTYKVENGVNAVKLNAQIWNSAETFYKTLKSFN